MGDEITDGKPLFRLVIDKIRLLIKKLPPDIHGTTWNLEDTMSKGFPTLKNDLLLRAAKGTSSLFKSYDLFHMFYVLQGN